MPKGSALERLKNIQALGADASITDLKYDDAVRQAKAHALCVGGSGRFLIGDDEYTIEPGSWIYVPEGYKHAFWNPDEAIPLEIICIVPIEGDVNPLVIPHQPEFC